MKKILFIALFTSLFQMAACQNTSSSSPGHVNEVVSVEQFEQKIAAAQHPQLIDVRTPDEYAEGHLKNAVNININSGDFDAMAGKLDKSKPVFVYCLSGHRSSNAAAKMQELGFTEVYNMNGGITKWIGAGKPVDQAAVLPK